MIGILAAMGGEFIIIYALSTFFFTRYVAWMMHVEIVRSMFMVDPSKGKKPRAAEKMRSKDNKTIYEEAKNSILNRIKITASACENIILFMEAFLKRVACK